MTSAVPILMYHEVSPRLDQRYRKYTLTPQELERQLDWLRANQYTTVTMDDVLAAWRGERALPPKPVAITFDDGGRDCIDNAVPALAERGFTATFYIVAGVVGGPMRWLRQEIGFELQAADWPALWAAPRPGHPGSRPRPDAGTGRSPVRTRARPHRRHRPLRGGRRTTAEPHVSAGAATGRPARVPLAATAVAAGIDLDDFRRPAEERRAGYTAPRRDRAVRHSAPRATLAESRCGGRGRSGRCSRDRRVSRPPAEGKR